MWVNSDATTHISVTIQGCLRNKTPTNAKRFIYVGDGNKALVDTIELFKLQLESSCYLDLYETFYIPSFRCNLIFISYLDNMILEIDSLLIRSFSYHGVNILVIF